MKVVVKKSTLKKTAIIALFIIFLTIFIYFASFFHSFNPPAKEERIIIRKPAVAGMFYPYENGELKKMIETYIGMVEGGRLSNVRALVMPHAGYVYSGITAAHAAYHLLGKNYKSVIILGPSHHAYFIGFSIANVTHYKTPFGLIRLDGDKVEKLRKEKLFNYDEHAHLKEHSIEVELPFLQYALGNFSLVPIVVGDVDPERLAEVIAKYVDEDTLIVASSDLSHYHDYETARKIDKNCIEAIPQLDFEKMKYCEACGKIPVLTLMYIAKSRGWKGKLLDYRNSGDTAGSKERVVGYASVAFYEEYLSAKERRFLLSLARKTLKQYLTNGTLPEVDETNLTPNLLKKSACFVTLNKHENLRGCIGNLIAQEKLYKCVMENAVNAAVSDLRFTPVDMSELKDITIEISILTPPKKVEYVDWKELLEKLTPHEDGVILRYHNLQATYLPQVWEKIPEKSVFLSELCAKAGAPYDCWKRGAEIYTYHAYVFEEKEK